MAAKIATDLNGEPRNEDEGMKRKVYVIQQKEVISYSYYVIADTQKEALEIFENTEHSDWDCELEKKDSQGTYKIDGSYCYHNEYKPTVEHKFVQELKKNTTWKDYQPLEWHDMEGESRW